MYKIVRKEVLNQAVILMEVEAPYIAFRCEAGQFLIARIGEDGERIPLTIADFDREKNTITIVFQTLGYSTRKMAELEVGDSFTDFVGPLGSPAPFHDDWKRIIGVAGGVGTAPLYCQLKELHRRGVECDVIIGGRSAEFVILVDLFKEICKNVYIMTDDGTLGDKGVVTKKLEELIAAGEKYDHVITIGPLIMMKFVVALTKQHDIPTSVSLNPIMIDGTGMCGGCRVTIDGQTKFACVDGPDFDGFKVDFDECMKRQGFFKEEEHECNLRLAQ